MKESTVAIVGLPNVGKSTLFNRLLGHHRALVASTPGVTRDRVAVEMRLAGRPMRLVDTGGIYADPSEGLLAQVHLQATVAIETASIVLLVMNVREGLTPADRELANHLRKSGRKVILIVNKVDQPSLEESAGEFYSLGLDELLCISAEHGHGISGLEERLVELLPEAPLDFGPEERPPLSLAIVGRPNVGKSTLLNHLAKEERAIVSSTPGTTRDSVDIVIRAGGRRYQLVDTAGIRRTGRRADRLEQGSTRLALESLRQSDVTLLLLDGSEGVTAQDLTVAGAAQEGRRPLIILVNKWDIRDKDEEAREAFRNQIERRFRFARYAPVLFISALTGLGIHRVFPLVEKVWDNGGLWIRSSQLNRMLEKLAVPGRGRDGRRVKSYYMTQTGIHPPTFSIFTNARGAVHFSYRRYVENQLREQFGFDRTPLILHWRRK